MDETLKIEPPVFVLFAEYLGYCSRFIEDCEKWCDGTIPSMYKQRAVIIEAKSILRQMLKDYSREEIINWYITYKEPLLKEYEDALSSIANEEEAMSVTYDSL